MIQCENLGWSSGKIWPLRACSLTLASGDCAILAGPSGAGKSTLLRLIAGVLPPSEGCVRIAGQLASEPESIVIPPWQRNVAFVTQDGGLWPGLAVKKQIEWAMSRARLSKSEMLKRCQEAMTECNLNHLADRPPEHLSGGEQQRVALARVLARGARYLLLDEPFTGMDLFSRRTVGSLLNRLRREHQWTVLAATHEPADAVLLGAQFVAVMESGAIREKIPLSGQVASPALTDTGNAWVHEFSAKNMLFCTAVQL